VRLYPGTEKQRKSPSANIIANYMLAPRPEEKPLTVIDTLESGMPPKRYRDFLISMVATQLLINERHKYGTYCPACEAPTCLHMGNSPDFLRYNTRTDIQKRVVATALE
jgi:hypothetical protein